MILTKSFLPQSGSNNPMYGKRHSLESKRKISTNRISSGVAKGRKNPNWKHGDYESTGTYKGLRNAAMKSFEYKMWRRRVFERDGYTCTQCNQHGGDLEADHIMPWRYYPKLRYDVDNGRTLCVKCHRSIMKDVFMHAKKLSLKKEDGYIGVDLDGVLAYYDNNKKFDPGYIGPPIQKMLNRVKHWMKEGKTVKIVTARASGNRPEYLDPIKKWLEEHDIGGLEITNEKDMNMIELWDDRCVQVKTNTGERVDGKS